MALVCGRCHHRFPGRYALRTLWCPLDRFYVCGRCFASVCKGGHGEPMATRIAKRKAASLLAVVALLFFAIIALPIEAPLVYEVTIFHHWRHASATPIDRLAFGSSVKVEGVLTSTSEVALGGHYEWGQGW